MADKKKKHASTSAQSGVMQHFESTLVSFERHRAIPGSAARRCRGSYWRRAAGLCGRRNDISFGECWPSPACTCVCISPGGTSKASVAASFSWNRCLRPAFSETQHNTHCEEQCEEVVDVRGGVYIRIQLLTHCVASRSSGKE